MTHYESLLHKEGWKIKFSIVAFFAVTCCTEEASKELGEVREYYVIRGFLICRIIIRPLVYGKEIKENKIDEKCRRILRH
jgi:hypothetical protein